MHAMKIIVLILVCYGWQTNLSGQEITKDWLMGHIDYSQDRKFQKLAKKHIDVSHDLYLHKQAYWAFRKMYEAAKIDGVTLAVLSAGRNFSDQKLIWEKKWKQQTIAKAVKRAQNVLEYSSMPGTSRHHWGTDIDMNSFSLTYYETEEGIKTYGWLQKNAKYFGFCQVYNQKNDQRIYGYKEEKWHWSYMPLARNLIEAYHQQIDYEDIQGFQGAGTAKSIQILEKYVFHINPKCR